MPSTKHHYDPSSDACLLTFQRHRDEEGNFLDIDTTVYLSKTRGYYQQEKRAQVWKDRCWENASVEVDDCDQEDARRRILECPCSALTPEQVIRMVVEQFVPEEGGARDLALRILDQSPIRSSADGKAIR
jgi:hypothetical protein